MKQGGAARFTAEHVRGTAAQFAALRDAEWISAVEELSVLADETDTETATHAVLDATNALQRVYLYADDSWNAGIDITPDHAELVWDARGEDTETPICVPAIILSSESGEPLTVRARTVLAFEQWPVACGDRVFIAMSEARARCVAAEDLETIQTKQPAQLSEALRRANLTMSDAHDRMTQWVLRHGLADLVHVTAGMLAAITERQSEWAAQAARDAVDTDAEAEAYLRAFLPVLRGEFARDESSDPIRSLMKGLQSSRLDLEVSKHCDRTGEALAPSSWIEMRADTGYSVIHAVSLRGDSSTAFDFRFEWIGACLAIPGTKPFDLGVVLNACFRNTATGSRTPWVTCNRWTRVDGVDDIVRQYAHNVFPPGQLTTAAAMLITDVCSLLQKLAAVDERFSPRITKSQVRARGQA